MNKEELRKEFDKFMDEHPDIVSYDDYEAGLIFEWLWKHLEQRETPYMKKETPEYEKLWDELATDLVNRNEIRSALSYMRGIREFKASLREEIEKEKVVRGVHGHYADGRTWAFEKCLELLDTVKPSTSKPEGNTVNK